MSLLHLITHANITTNIIITDHLILWYQMCILNNRLVHVFYKACFHHKRILLLISWKRLFFLSKRKFLSFVPHFCETIFSTFVLYLEKRAYSLR